MAFDEIERKLRAILSADVVGYSRLMAEDEDATVRTLADYREIVSLLVVQQRGEIADFTGDNFLASFPSAVDAVRSAMEIQRVLQARNAGLPVERRLEFRMGLNVGEVRIESGRLYGDGVNIAARLEALAEPGGLCLSEGALEEVRSRLDIEAEDLGEQQVKNIPRPIRVYSIVTRAERLEERPRAAGSATSGEPRATRWRWIAGVAALMPVALLAGWLIARSDRSAPVARPGQSDIEASSGLRMVAVLPFENLGPPEEAYFAAGITEEIISRLAAVHGLSVRSRTSIAQYDQTGKTMQQIGADLAVDYVLEGTVRWARSDDGSSRVRITPQLIRVADDSHLWTDRYDRQLEDIFEVQSEIAARVIERMGVVLLDPADVSAPNRGTDSIEAYDLYMRAGEYRVRGREVDDPQALELAIEFYGQAIALDPGYALAHAQQANTHARMYSKFFDRSEKRLRLVEEAAKTAIDLAPQLPEAHLALGFFYKSDQESDKALHEFELALAGRPGDSNVEQAIGELYWFTGQLEDATVHYQRATELEPQRSELYCEYGGVYRMAGVASEAVDHHRHAIELRPDRACPYFCLFYIHLTWDGPARARSFLEEDLSPLVGLEDMPPLDYLWVVIDLVDGNYRQALDRVEARDGDAYSWQHFYSPRSLVAAQIQDLLGRPDDARREYESARRHLEARVRERPGDPRFHSSLGIALAGLGQGDAAINAGRQAVTLLPVERDKFTGAYRLKDMAQIYLMVGRPEEALDALELLFEAPSQIHLPEIHLDPMWAELRGRPRFEALRSPANPLTAG